MIGMAAIGKCLKCDKVEEMTEDHVVPQWFNKALINFGLTKLQDGRSELLCKGCNSNKGGKIDYTREHVRVVMKQFIAAVVADIRKHEEFNP